MSLESIACHRCGTLLDVADGVRFVTCRSCNTALSVQRSASSAWTEPTTEERLDRLEDSVDQLAVRNELDALDRQWDRERDDYAFRTRHGYRHFPTKAGSVGMGVLVAVFGLMWTFMASGMLWRANDAFHDAPPGFGPSLFDNFFPLFGLLFVAFGIGAGIYGYRLAERYEAAKAGYEQKRAAIEAKLKR